MGVLVGLEVISERVGWCLLYYVTGIRALHLWWRRLVEDGHRAPVDWDRSNRVNHNKVHRRPTKGFFLFFSLFFLLKRIELAETLSAWIGRDRDCTMKSGLWIPEPLQAGSTLRMLHSFKHDLPSMEKKGWLRKQNHESRGQSQALNSSQELPVSHWISELPWASDAHHLPLYPLGAPVLW